MAATMAVRPGQWNELFGAWFWIKPDPLVGTEWVRITVHRDGEDFWFHAEGPNAGVHVQTTAPDAS
jgi:hypothetical protein